MSSVTASFGAARGRRRRALTERFADESLLVIVFATFAAVVGASAAPFMVQPDSWLTFLGGREIAAHGVPGRDSLTIMTDGHRWIDQQWLSQLATYRLEAAVGLGATVAVFVVIVAAAYALACTYARRTASARSVVVFAMLALPVAYCAVRAQAFSYLAFVPFFAFLCRESRRPTRRVWLVLPVLAVWANVHGTVLVAAALVALLGVVDAAQRRWARGGGLVVGALVSVFVTPYGLGILPYYRATMANPMFKKYITEWAPPTFFSFTGLPFFVAAGLAIFLVARRPRALSRFELAALGLTLVGALTAQRSMIWFAYAALLLLPRLLDEVWPARPFAPRMRTLLAALAATARGFALRLTVATVSSASRRIDTAYPPRALHAVAAALAADPKARVLADDRTSDWLLYRLPQLRLRLAFDGRWEVLSPTQFALVRNYVTQAATGVDRLARGYQVFVVDRTWHPALARWYAGRRDLRVLYRGDRVAVYQRS
jgi:hypothetical protein